MACQELTPEDLKATSGCGSTYWLAYPFRIPKWLSRGFWRCCNRHDLRYQYNYSLGAKMAADDELYDCMYYAAFHGPRWGRPVLTRLADFVYWCLSTKLSMRCYMAAGPE